MRDVDRGRFAMIGRGQAGRGWVVDHHGSRSLGHQSRKRKTEKQKAGSREFVIGSLRR
jgi:hypothetical protein